MSFPVSYQDLTADWLTEALGYRVKGFTVAPLGEGVGVIGLVTRVHLDADDGPESLIAKFPSPFPGNRAVADTYDMYEREYRFYTEVAPRVPIRAPTCYHAEFNLENRDFVLLLEDLSGFRVGDQVQGCTVSEAHRIIASLAALHRHSWQPDDSTGIREHDTPSQREGMIGGFRMGWPFVLENFPRHFTDERVRFGALVPDSVNRLLDEIHEGPLVIAHGDVRLDNVFFSEEGIALVDYQAVCKAAPEHDLAYFVTQSLPDHVRQAQDWHRVYFRHLVSKGIEYDRARSFERYRRCALYFLCYAVVIAGTLDMANERGRLLADRLLGNSLRSISELNAFDFLKS